MATFTSTFSGNAVAGFDGVAVITLGPQRAGERWVVKRQTIQNSGNATNNECICKVYRNVISDTTLLDGSFTGVFDVSNNDNINVESGSQIIAEWSGCIPGSVSTWTIEAEVTR